MIPRMYSVVPLPFPLSPEQLVEQSALHVSSRAGRQTSQSRRSFARRAENPPAERDVLTLGSTRFCGEDSGVSEYEIGP